MVDFYAPGVLDPDRHEGLVRDHERILRNAGIPGQEALLAAPTESRLKNQDEVEWLRSYPARLRGDGPAGLVWLGALKPVADLRASMHVAVLVRNFRSAVLVSLSELVIHLKEGAPPQHEAVAVPDLVTANTVKALFPSDRDNVAAWIKTRARGRQCFMVGVSGWHDATTAYGAQVESLLRGTCEVISK